MIKLFFLNIFFGVFMKVVKLMEKMFKKRKIFKLICLECESNSSCFFVFGKQSGSGLSDEPLRYHPSTDYLPTLCLDP